MAGLVMHEAQTIPETGQTFNFYGYRFEVVRKQRNRITGVRVRRLNGAPVRSGSVVPNDRDTQGRGTRSDPSKGT